MSEHPKVDLELPLAQYLEAPVLDSQSSPSPGTAHFDRAHMWSKICARRAPAEPAGRTERALPLPLKQALVEADELATSRARLFRQVRARIERPKTRAIPRRLLVACALLGTLACLRVAWPAFQHQDPRGLALVGADGKPFGPLETGSQGRVIRLSDASEIRLAPFARVEPLLSSATRFELLLRRGSAEFSVTPGGPRRWLVEAGAASVEVVGTVFRVTRRAESVSVSVSRGAVLVRGEQVHGWVRRLSAGQRLDVPAQPTARMDSVRPPSPPDLRARQDTTAPTAAVDTSGQRVASGSPPAPERQRTPSTRNRRRVAIAAPLFDSQADPHDSYDSLGPAGMARATMQASSIESLLELADIARLSGHPQDAVAPLNRALDAFRSSPQAGLAAFTLGRVLLEQLSAPAAAAEAFERAISLYLPRSLLSDCYRRLAEAYDRAGNVSARDAVAERYRSAFPSDGHGVQEAMHR